MIRMGMFLGDRYEIIEKIGAGGMADVFKGKDHKLNRMIAIKVLKDEYVEDKNFVRKFKEEAQAAAGLAHPNIVNVYDVGEEQNINYIVMELVEGITLKSYIERKGKLTVKEATSIAIQVSSGLEIAHNNHIIHRDIKPQNIIISKEGKVKVTDFGIAKSISSNTNTSDAMGSVHYTSPEQARGGYSDAKSDIYSLGIVMYEMVTGRVPFDGDTTVVVAVKHLQEAITSPRVYASDVPVSLEHIILKCTEKSPDRRYVNITELMADLKQSLITPEVNFVKAVAVGGAKTVALTREDVKQIKKETGKIQLEDDMSNKPFDDYSDEYPDDRFDEDEFESDEDEDDNDEGILDPKLEKIMTIGGIVAAVIIVIIVIFIIAKLFGIGKSTTSSTDNETTIEDVIDGDSELVTVPDLAGMSYSEAKEALNELGLGIQFGETKESEEYEEGQIIEQSVEAGEEVEENTTITVTICSGGEEIEIPDVVGKSELQASNTLTAAGFSPDTSTAFSDTVEEGKVISTSPKAGKTATKGSVVTMVISKGPEEVVSTKVIVPEIVGRTEARAKEKLAAVNLAVGTVTEEYSDDYDEGYVISQSVSAGTELEEGTAVSYVLSKGPETVEVAVPNVIGQSSSTAKANLESSGFSVTVKKNVANTDASKNDTVESTSPGAGSYLEKGSTVTIYVYVDYTAPEPEPEPETPATPAEGSAEGWVDANSDGVCDTCGIAAASHVNH